MQALIWGLKCLLNMLRCSVTEITSLLQDLTNRIRNLHHKKEVFDLNERHFNSNLDLANKDFLFSNYTVDIFLFVTAIILLVVTIIVMFILCKHMKLKTLVSSLALQQIKEVGMVAKQEHVFRAQDIKCTCKIQWYTIIMLSIFILGIVIFIILKVRNLKLFRGHLFSNAVKVMLFISDAQYYVHIIYT